MNIEELEAAATLCTTSYDPIERQNAESVISRFRHLPNSYKLCEAILERSKNECLLYETAKTLAQCILREWDEHFENDTPRVLAMMKHLLTWCVNGPSSSALPANGGLQTSSYVRESVLRTCAVMVKRHCASQCHPLNNESEPSNRQDSTVISTQAFQDLMPTYLRIALEFIHTPQLEKQVIGVSMWSALLLEMSQSKEAYFTSLQWGKIVELKIRFERGELRQLFVEVIQLCQQICVSSEDLTQPQHFSLLHKLLTVLNTIFDWVFMPPSLTYSSFRAMGTSEDADFQPTIEWRPLFENDESVIRVLYSLHLRVRTNCDLGVLSLHCWVKAASLKSSFFTDHQAEATYSWNWIRTAMEFIRNAGMDQQSPASFELIDYEYPPLIEVILESLTFTEVILKLLEEVSTEEQVKEKLGQVLTFTAKLAMPVLLKAMEGAALEVLTGNENMACSESVERMMSHLSYFLIMYPGQVYETLDCNRAFAFVYEASGTGTLAQVVREFQNLSDQVGKCIFEKFVRAHLADPDGFRNRTPEGHIICESTASAGKEREIDLDVEEDDRVAYQDLLRSVGLCGCLEYVFSLPLLLRLLFERLSTPFFTGSQQQPLEANTSSGGSQHWLLEDVHWLLLTTGNLLESLSTPAYPALDHAHSPGPNNNVDFESGGDFKSIFFLRECFQEWAAEIRRAPTTSESAASTAALRRTCLQMLQRHVLAVQQHWDDVTPLVKLYVGVHLYLQSELLQSHSAQLAGDLFWLLAVMFKKLFITSSHDCDCQFLCLMLMCPVMANVTCHGNTSLLHHDDFLTVHLDFVIRGFQQYSGEEAVLLQMREFLFCMLSLSTGGTRLLLHSNKWWRLVERLFTMRRPFVDMPVRVCRKLARTFTEALAHPGYSWHKLETSPDAGLALDYLQKIVSMLHGSLCEVLSSERGGVVQPHQVGQRLQVCLELMQGVFTGMHRATYKAQDMGERIPYLEQKLALLEQCLTHIVAPLTQAWPHLVKTFHAELFIMAPLWKLMRRCCGLALLQHEFSRYARSNVTYLQPVFHGLLFSGVKSFTDLLVGVSMTEEYVEQMRIICSSLDNMTAALIADEACQHILLTMCQISSVVSVEWFTSSMPLCQSYFGVYFSLLLRLQQPELQRHLWDHLVNVNSLQEEKPFTRQTLLRHLHDTLASRSSITAEVNKRCLEMLYELAACVLKLADTEASRRDACCHLLKPFLSLVFHKLTDGEMELDLIDIAASTVLVLICCNKEAYKDMVNAILNSVSDAAVVARLRTAFEALTPNVDQLSILRVHETSFVHRFQKFLVDIRSFLFVL